MIHVGRRRLLKGLPTSTLTQLFLQVKLIGLKFNFTVSVNFCCGFSFLVEFFDSFDY